MNRLAACSLLSKTKLVLRWIGTARAPVAGSGAAPACSARVSKPGSDRMGAGHGQLFEAVDAAALWAILICDPALRPASAAGTPMKVTDILRVKGNTLYTVHARPAAGRGRAQTMAELDIGSLVVMEHGDLVGMLTFREVIIAVVANGGSVGTRRCAR